MGRARAVDNKKNENLRTLVERARDKIELIRSGSAFTADFECASMMEVLVQEIELLSLENKNYKKKLSYRNIFFSKQEIEIKSLQQEKQKLLERISKIEGKK